MTTPIGWKKGRLGEQCSIEIGGTPSRNITDYWDDSKETSNLWVSIRDLNQRVITRTAEHISDSGVKQSNVKLQTEGTVLLSFKLTIGRVGVAGCPLYTNEAIAGLRSKEITQGYLYHGLQQWDLLQGVDQAIKGATLNKAKLKRIEFCFPESRLEQNKIAEILLTVDKAIEQAEALIAKQQRVKAGLMQDLLTRGIDKHGILRSEQTHAFKDSPLGRIPADWEVTPISSVLAAPPKNGFSPVESSEWNGSYVLGLGCLTVEGFRAKQLKFAPRATPSIEVARLQPGDFLISRSNTRSLVGLVGIFQDVGEPCTYPDLMVRLVFSGEVCAEYMEQVFMSPLMRRQIENAATGTSGSMVKISAALIRGFVFMKPPVEEQHRILYKLKAEDSNLDSNVQSLGKLRSLKTALMQDLLTGKKRVTALMESEAPLMKRVS